MSLVKRLGQSFGRARRASRERWVVMLMAEQQRSIVFQLTSLGLAELDEDGSLGDLNLRDRAGGGLADLMISREYGCHESRL